jgi:phage/plasmid-associated DNA primase
LLSQGTLTELLKNTLDMYFGELSINFYTNFSKAEDTANNNLADIVNARLVNTSEVGTASNSNEGQKFITSKLKMLSGGDTITCRRGYSMQQLQFKAGKLWIQTNIMSTFTGKNTDNTSLKERIEIIEFPYSFVDDEYMIETNTDKYKKRNNEVKSLFQSPVNGYATFVPKWR